MFSCNVIEIVTPKKFVLNGLWYGPVKPRRVVVWLHGLTGSAFSGRGLISAIIDEHTAVVTFNTRGANIVSNLRQKVGNETKYHLGGTAHEIFTDCIDDIDGVLQFVRAHGAKNIYIAGHSTGCQKAVYWASKKGSGVKGLLLLAPLSDYAGNKNKPQLRRAVALAKKMVKAGKGGELLPKDVWWECLDAQRLLSLYTPDSVEEIFSYAQKDRDPKIYKSVKLPMLALFAGADEYADRPAEELVEWFRKNSRAKKFESKVIPGVGHSFKEGEELTAKTIKNWLQTVK